MNLTIFESKTRAYIQLPEQQVDKPWPEIVTLLSENQQIVDKNDGLLFNLVKFKTLGDPTAEPGRNKVYKNNEWTGEYIHHTGTVRRCRANVIGINGIVLDVDNTMSIEQVIDRLDGVEYLLYTTFNHTQQSHRFRVVIPFSQLLLAEDIAGREDSIRETFPGVDQSSFSVSQSFYFHSGHNDPIVYHNRGYIIDPYAFEYRAPDPRPDTSVSTIMTDDTSDLYKTAVLESLLSCHDVRYRCDKTGGILTLITICRSIGLTYDEFDIIARQIGGVDSTIQEADKRKSAWQDWNGNRITAQKRDKFIAEYGGQPLSLKIKIINTNNI